ncbi:CobW family GTP-binding protein [Spirosoma foliorum]|uniref:GTP-binding protein n=1 Tax=Spirosoma foliorum TaxID=2710596 RepID=A0A7G5GPC8_9BACT|nr:GTP-binding protein [Spirosoma foliorum]QMW00720.1 GTP-binding protein [Spirosoma foliorum]
MPKDVTLLTGFLGSGKTTLLNAILSDRPQTRFALIENEFGEESIDGQLVMRPDVDVTELSNGCLCCSLNDDLLNVLEALDDRRDKFDELIIETTGIADPSGVAVPFLMLPIVKRSFTLKRVICLVDAEHVEDQLRDTEEAIQQISFSDVILLNKTDRVSPDYLAQLQDTLRSLNPFAQVLLGHKEAYPVDELMRIERDTAATDQPATLLPLPLSSTNAFQPLAKGIQNRSLVRPVHQHHHHTHSSIVSLSFRFEEPFNLTRLYNQLTTLLLYQGQGIYRIKGIIADVQRPNRMILQSVGSTMTLAEGANWLPDESRISRIVFIGKLLKPEGFETLLKDCLTKDSQ